MLPVQFLLPRGVYVGAPKTQQLRRIPKRKPKQAPLGMPASALLRQVDAEEHADMVELVPQELGSADCAARGVGGCGRAATAPRGLGPKGRCWGFGLLCSGRRK
jgi:hypothetical protein